MSSPSRPPKKPFLPLASVVAAPEFAPPGDTGDTALPYQPTVFRPAAQILGDSGSSEALKVLLEQADHIKRADTLALLKEALTLFRQGDWKGGGERAINALHVDEKSGEAWHVLAIARDKCNDFATALTCYETALRLMPDNLPVANDLGRLAYRLGQNELAERFFRFFLAREPHNVEAINNLASTLREENRLEEAIDLLKAAITHNQTDAQLWNALGTVVNTQGDVATSVIFYEESLKFDPTNVHARYNLGNAKAVAGNVAEGLKELLTALPLFTDPINTHSCRLSIAFCYLILGDYEQGWTWYHARLKDDTIEKMHYVVPRPHWGDAPNDKAQSLAGKRLFVSAEQGLGDEVLFGSLMPDLLREIGPDGHLAIGVEPRLVPLFRRGFPEATVVRQHTTKHQGQSVRLFPDLHQNSNGDRNLDWESYDAWALMGDFLSRYRKTEADFPKSNVFFRPDPERVAYWKAILGGLNDKPKVGLLWKSLIKHSRRDRYYSPFEQWKDILAIDGIQFVNLQYGDTTAEMAEAEAMGLDIWTPPGIDLKNDLDDLSALCSAMDCLLGPANATSNIAAAAGACVWLLSTPRSWTCLGTDYFPWYPTVRVFSPETLLDWAPVMGEIRQALIDSFTGPAQASHALR